MNMPTRHIRLRAGGLALMATACVAGLAAALLPSIDLDPSQQFAALLTQWSGVVLLGCALWAWLVTVVVLAEALRAAASGTALPVRRQCLPSGYRRLVLAACGLALTAGTAAPALATPGPVHLDTHTVGSHTIGSPVGAVPGPSVHHAADGAAQRAPIAVAPVPRHRQASDGDEIVVRPGDSLWHLAAERLSEDADDATIAHTWRRLYETNAQLIGADPDHIEPGQRLDRPEGW